jgi:hypothetical protein
MARYAQQIFSTAACAACIETWGLRSPRSLVLARQRPLTCQRQRRGEILEVNNALGAELLGNERDLRVGRVVGSAAASGSPPRPDFARIWTGSRSSCFNWRRPAN